MFRESPAKHPRKEKLNKTSKGGGEISEWSASLLSEVRRSGSRCPHALAPAAGHSEMAAMFFCFFFGNVLSVDSVDDFAPVVVVLTARSCAPSWGRRVWRAGGGTGPGWGEGRGAGGER